ncbi:MAG: hypothetical protein EON89_04960 [Brevundimonas sp.]|nr:MAG: hypothetical protein EON89_04960 [Brevundimonas sp.]
MQQTRDRLSSLDRERMESELQPGARQRTDRRGRQPTPDQIAQSAQAAATEAGLSCRVKESALLGATNDNHDLYEVACEGGAGYILTSATPPQTFDCLVLSAQADRLRAEGGEVAANSVCTLPGNQNSAVMIAGYAREAGVPCQVDAGKALGATPEGNLVFEVGCAGSDGYHIEKTAQGWSKTDCLQAMGMNLTCQFTTVEEQVAGFQPLLANTAIDDCVAQQIHMLAQNDTGRFIEIKCASGDGYVARVKDNAVNQIYPCAAAARIGGGCTLTPVAAAQAAPAPTSGRP